VLAWRGAIKRQETGKTMGVGGATAQIWSSPIGGADVAAIAAAASVNLAPRVEND
jgi:hypothetical protein